MKNIKQYVLLICCSLGMLTYAQEKVSKPTQTIKTSKNPVIELNTNNVNLELDTWGKDYVEVEAYMESTSLSKEDLRELLKDWKVELTTTNDGIKIVSKSQIPFHHKNKNVFFIDETNDAIKELKFEIADIPELKDGLAYDFEIAEGPIVIDELHFMDMDNFPELPDFPELPELGEGVHEFKFDYKAYKKDGEKYLQKWSEDFEKKYGKSFQKKMEKWAEKLSDIDFDAYDDKVMTWTKEITQKNGETSEKELLELQDKIKEAHKLRMEVIRERHKERRKHHEEMRKEREEHREVIIEKRNDLRERMREERERGREREKIIIMDKAHKPKRLHKNKDLIKTIKIKMPKKAKLDMNVKHGELKLSSVINNMKADIAYATLLANRIDGGKTSINTSFSNVTVNDWNSGELQLHYVENATLKHVNTMVLGAKSSNVMILSLDGPSIMDHSFGDFTIKEITPNMINLNLTLNSSDALLTLPKSDYQLIFKGERSKLNNTTTSSEIINKSGSNKNIIVNANFSKIYTK